MEVEYPSRVTVEGRRPHTARRPLGVLRIGVAAILGLACASVVGCMGVAAATPVTIIDYTGDASSYFCDADSVQAPG